MPWMIPIGNETFRYPGKKPEVLSNNLDNDKTCLLVYLLHSFSSSFYTLQFHLTQRDLNCRIKRSVTLCPSHFLPSTLINHSAVGLPGSCAMLLVLIKQP